MKRLKKTGELFVISGPSGAGKGTICGRILSETDAEVSISMTTRHPRGQEQDGVEYYFRTKEQFLDTVEKGGLLEYAQVYENYYGTPKAPVLEKLEQGIDVILEIDMQGAMQVKKNYPDAVLIFVIPPSQKVLRERLIGRGTETAEAVELRLGQTLNELTYADKYDYCVVNDDLDTAVSQVRGIMETMHLKVDFTAEELIAGFKEEE